MRGRGAVRELGDRLDLGVVVVVGVAVGVALGVISLRVGDVTVDLSTHDVHRNTQRIELSPRELMLLKVLMREPGCVFTRTELCERVWEHAHEYDTKLVEVFIGRLRKKLGEPPLIHTIRHVGYTIGRPEGKIRVRRGTNSQRGG